LTETSLKEEAFFSNSFIQFWDHILWPTAVQNSGFYDIYQEFWSRDQYHFLNISTKHGWFCWLSNNWTHSSNGASHTCYLCSLFSLFSIVEKSSKLVLLCETRSRNCQSLSKDLGQIIPRNEMSQSAIWFGCSLYRCLSPLWCRYSVHKIWMKLSFFCHRHKNCFFDYLYKISLCFRFHILEAILGEIKLLNQFHQ
jgi:hypothetical protein